MWPSGKESIYQCSRWHVQSTCQRSPGGRNGNSRPVFLVKRSSWTEEPGVPGHAVAKSAPLLLAQTTIGNQEKGT